MFFVRTYSPAKWKPRDHLAAGEIAADAVTLDLRTTNDALSVWRCENGDKSDLDEVVLAIAAGRERLDRCFVVCLSGDELEEDGVSWTPSAGRTPVSDLAERHADLCRLDYARLGLVARRMQAAIGVDRTHRPNRQRVGELLLAAVAQGRVDADQLHDRLKRDLEGIQ